MQVTWAPGGQGRLKFGSISLNPGGQEASYVHQVPDSKLVLYRTTLTRRKKKTQQEAKQKRATHMASRKYVHGVLLSMVLGIDNCIVQLESCGTVSWSKVVLMCMCQALHVMMGASE